MQSEFVQTSCNKAIRDLTHGMDGFIGYCLGSALKAIWSWPVSAANLRKAQYYLQSAIDALDEDRKHG